MLSMARGSVYCSVTNLVTCTAGGCASTGPASSTAQKTIRFILLLLELVCNPVNDNTRVFGLQLDGQRRPTRGGRDGPANYRADDMPNHLRRGGNRRQETRSLGYDRRRPQRHQQQCGHRRGGHRSEERRVGKEGRYRG